MALHACLALGLLWLVPACDGGGGDDEAADSSGDASGGQPCGTEWADKSGEAEDIMGEYGAPCLQDSDCTPILGDDGVCVTNILGVYDLPGGFCSKYCELPDAGTSFEHNNVMCDPNGGVTCVGANGLFTACILECETSDQCGREGYGCRTMPTLAAEGDPKFCLMSPTDCCTTDSGECAP